MFSDSRYFIIISCLFVLSNIHIRYSAMSVAFQKLLPMEGWAGLHDTSQAASEADLHPTHFNWLTSSHYVTMQYAEHSVSYTPTAIVLNSQSPSRHPVSL